MKPPALITLVIAGIILPLVFVYAAAENFTGEFADKTFMNGQAVLQLSLEQNGNKVTIFFSGVRNDGQGAAPEINAIGTVSGGSVQFKFEDDLKNGGTGTITTVPISNNVNYGVDPVPDPLAYLQNKLPSVPAAGSVTKLTGTALSTMLTSLVAPVCLSWTKISKDELVSAGSRLVAWLVKVT